MASYVRIIQRPTGSLLADGLLGWSITPLEGNYYISKKNVRTSQFRPHFMPGICPYKFLFVWRDLVLADGQLERNLGWLYWLPNPLLPLSGFE